MTSHTQQYIKKLVGLTTCDAIREHAKQADVALQTDLKENADIYTIQNDWIGAGVATMLQLRTFCKQQTYDACPIDKTRIIPEKIERCSNATQIIRENINAKTQK